jgi:DNA replication protein DnaC
MHEESLAIILKELRLFTMSESWQSVVSTAEEEHWNYSKFLKVMCEEELACRQRKRVQTLTKKSQLPVGKFLGNFDFAQVPTINKTKIDNIVANSSWVKLHENILIFGPSGVGKSHLAAAIGYELIQQNIKVLFTSTTKLVQQLQAARRDCCLPADLAKLDKYDVIILDDIGYVRKDESETHVLFELIAQRYESGSIILTSNQPFSEWDNIFATNSMTVAAIDRLVHHATILEIQSGSYRQQQALRRQSDNELRLNLKGGQGSGT